MTGTKRGRRLAYAHILRALDPVKRYGVNDIMRFAEENGFVVPSPDDPRKHGKCTIPLEQIRERIRRRLTCYKEQLDPAEGLIIYGDSYEEIGWYACYWQSCILKMAPTERRSGQNLLKKLQLKDLRIQMAEETACSEQCRVNQDLDTEIAAIKDELSKCAKIKRKLARHQAQKARLRPKGLRLVVLLTLAGLVATAGGVVMVLHPFDVLRSHGPAAARKALGDEASHTPEGRYQHCWLAFLEGDLEQASRGVYAILAEDDVSSYLRANCFYLLASIQSKTGHYQIAVGYYGEAYEHYGLNRDQANMFNSAVELANAHVELGQHTQADHWLGQARRHFQADRSGAETIVDLGQFHLVRADLAAAKGDYPTALASALARLVQAEQTGDQAKRPYALGLVGFWYTVNGCPDQGAHYTKVGSEAARALGDERALVFCLVNTVLVARDEHQTIAYIRSWADLREDARLAKTLDLALKIPLRKDNDACESIDGN